VDASSHQQPFSLPPRLATFRAARRRRLEAGRVGRAPDGGLAGEVLGGDGGKMLTEMDDAELMKFVALDLSRATGDV